MSKVVTLLALGLIAYYWSLTQKLKSMAIRAAQLRCREAGVQFLDHSVVQASIKLTKDQQYRLGVRRRYQFEFTSTGEHRYTGTVVVHSGHVIDVELEPFQIN